MRFIPIALSLFVAAPALADEVRVVATFSVLADMVETVGGERVDVTSLVGRGGDTHVFRPSPAEARALAEADAVVTVGLGLEGWMDRLIEASGFSGERVVTGDRAIAAIHHGPAGAAARLSDHSPDDEHHAEHDGDHHDDADHAKDATHAGEEHDHGGEAEQLAARQAESDHGHDHGAIDPHVWQSFDGARGMIDAIAAGLSGVDPEGAETYAANAAAYRAEVDAVDRELAALFEELPADRRTVMTLHDAFGYLGEERGIAFVAPLGLSTESEASARDMAALIREVRNEGVDAVFFEAGIDPRLLDQLAGEAGVAIGGTLYPGTLSEPDGPAATYLEMMRYNGRALAAALKPAA